MIRSIPVNIFGIVLGLGILVVGFAYLTEDVGHIGFKGLLNPHALLIGGFNIALGSWAFVGSIRNLKNRRKFSKRPLTLPETGAAVVLAVSMGCLVLLVVLLRAPSTPLIQRISWLSAIVIVSAVPLGIIIAIWSAVSQRLTTRKAKPPKVESRSGERRNGTDTWH